MKEQDNNWSNPFQKERQEGDRPARFYLDLGVHEPADDIFEFESSALEKVSRMGRVFKKGEKNVLWVECSEQGKTIQRLFDIAVEKVSGPLNRFAFSFYAMNAFPDHAISKDFSEEFFAKVERMEYSDWIAGEYFRGLLNDPRNLEYSMIQMFAAQSFFNEGYDVDVVFENSADREPEARLKVDLDNYESFSEALRLQRVREDRIVGQWQGIIDQASESAPINIYAHLGAFHNGIVNRFSGDFDIISVCDATINPQFASLVHQANQDGGLSEGVFNEDVQRIEEESILAKIRGELVGFWY